MESLKLKSSDLEQLQNLGKGACGTVYRYGENLVIKVLNDKGMELHNNEGFSGLVGVENGTCIFPKFTIEIDQQFQGYAMQYVEGEKLQKVIKELDFNSIINAINKVEQDLMTLASDKILFMDFNEGGLMWNEKDGMKIIDTDFFSKNDEITEEECYSHNIIHFYSLIEQQLGILNGQDNKIINFIQSNQEYTNTYKDYFISSLLGTNMSITVLINKMIDVFEKEFGVKPTSIVEMNALLEDKTKPGLEVQDIPTFEPPSEDNKQDDFIDYNKIIEEMPKGLTQIEKARYIYIQLGKYFSYDQRYITSQNDEEKREIFDRDVNDIVDDKVVCTSLSRIYENLLNRVGINAKTVLIPGERLGHAFTELEIDGNKYYTGLIRDLMRIKTGFKTQEFLIDNPDRFVENSEHVVLSDEDLKRIDDKIGYTFNRYVYGRINKNVKRRNELT